MSDGVNLSQEIISNLLKNIAEHDKSAEQDMMVNIQYLVAVAGYLMADFPGPVSERDEMLEGLSGFMKHVCNERAGSKPQSSKPSEPASPEAAAGSSVETDDPAVGIWKPE